jgi:hypothetical protein
MSQRDALLIARGVPAWTLRVAILVVGTVLVMVPVLEGITFGALVLLLPAMLASVYAPASPAPAGVVVAVAVMVGIAGGDPLRAEVLLLIPLVHLFHVLCGIAGVLPAAGRLHPKALRAPALRFLLVQAIVFLVVLLSAVLPAGRTPVALEVAGLVGLTALALMIVWLQRVK